MKIIIDIYYCDTSDIILTMARKTKRSAGNTNSMEDQTSHGNDIEADCEATQDYSRALHADLQESKFSRIPGQNITKHLECSRLDSDRVDSAFLSGASDSIDVAYGSEDIDNGKLKNNADDVLLRHENASDKQKSPIQSESDDDNILPMEARADNQCNLEAKMDDLALDDSDDEGVCLSSVPDEMQNLDNTSSVNDDLIRVVSPIRENIKSAKSARCENVNDRITPLALLVYGKDTDGDTMLHIAIIQCCIDLALRFIRIAPWYDWLDIFNENLRQTPLHLAVLTKLKTVVRRLMVGGANVEMRDHSGDTPLHIACRKGCMAIVQTILEPITYEETLINEYDVPYQLIPQNLELRNYDGFTCLHVAAESNHTDILMYLISKGADINAGDGKSGKTILHFAAENNNFELMRILLKQNTVLIDAKTYNGCTPLLIAHGRKNSAILDLLLKAGANPSCLEETDFSDSDDD